MKLTVVGCNHHNADVALRERLAFSAAQAPSALGEMRKQFPAAELVLLSTCNRMEIYTAAENPDHSPTHEQLVDFIAGFHGLNAYDIFDDLFERTGEDAVRHLFTVAASLDSMVVGEAQILSQVKQAYQLAADHDFAGPLTHSVFQKALQVAKRVATETNINQNRVSIPSVAVADFAKQIFERFDDKRVLVIGAGEMAEETVHYLRAEGAKDINIVNRSFEKAEQLAREWQGTARRWDELDDLLVEADMVVSTTGASEPVVTAERFADIHPRRYQRSLMVLDLAIPRDFEPGIGDKVGVFLYDIDDLRQVCEENRRARQKELPTAMKLIEEATLEFMTDLHHRATSPVIRRLRQGWQGPKEEELERLLNKLPDLDEREREEIRISFERLVNKLLHPPLESLRDEARDGVPHVLLDALKTLFKLRD